jgi:hypothetical protein
VLPVENKAISTNYIRDPVNMVVMKESHIPLLGVRSDYLNHICSQMTKLVKKKEAFVLEL